MVTSFGHALVVTLVGVTHVENLLRALANLSQTVQGKGKLNQIELIIADSDVITAHERSRKKNNKKMVKIGLLNGAKPHTINYFEAWGSGVSPGLLNLWA